MDANGQRFFLLADPADFLGSERDVAYDAQRRRLGLASTRVGPAPRAVDEADARALLELAPGALDAFGTYAWWDADARRVLASGALEEPEERERTFARRRPPVPFFPQIPEPPLSNAPTDVCLGEGGVVAIALGGKVTLVDTRERFSPTEVPLEGFDVFRLAAAKGSGFVALARASGALARLTGKPAAELPPEAHAPGVFRPCRENPNPPTWQSLPKPAWDAGETPVAVAVSPGGDVVVLSWSAEGDARIRVLAPGASAWKGPLRLTAGLGSGSSTEASPATWAASLAFLGEGRLAVLVPGLFVEPTASATGVSEALVFAWPLVPRMREGRLAELLPLGDFYPLTDPARGALSRDRAAPLFRGPAGHVGYATSTGPRALAPLSRKAMATTGSVRCRALDAQAAGTAWHRVYMEASIPDGTGVRLWLGATDGAGEPAPEDFFPHDFGHVPAPTPGIEARHVPRGAFVHARSEIPFEPGFLGCDPDPPRVGLFTALVQRAGRAVRTLAGRRLHVRLELFGNGALTPEIAAIRVYAPRFSYVEEYLPDLYAETVFGADADHRAPATGSDFLGRLLAIVEGELTPMEDRVAAAYLLTDPRKTPDEALDWLASWVGLTLDPSLPPPRRRALLEAAPALARRHGTLEGLVTALDVVTGGGVTSGRIVVVEDYRMRRVFATILGAHLEEQDDPLLPGGLIVSGNSYVGDTLWLGEGTRDELLELAALYRGDSASRESLLAGPPPLDDPDDGFYERFAFRVTILVHQDAAPEERGFIDRAIALSAPAHVDVRVVAARAPFITGVASLVGVDSFLGPPRGLAGFRLDRSALGERDVLARPQSLDPRLEGSSPEEMP